MNLSFKEKNLFAVELVDAGFGAKAILKKLKIKN